MAKKSIATTTLPQGNPLPPLEIPRDEPTPYWILSGLYTWRHLESRLFQWDRGTFGERWVQWQKTINDRAFKSPNRIVQFFSNLLFCGWWDSTVALLDFHRPNERIGDMAELEILSLFLTGYFRGQSADDSSSFIDDDRSECVFPPHHGRVASASVILLHDSPWRELRKMPHELSVPVFDCRKSAKHVVHPYLIESCRWPLDPTEWSNQLINSKPDGLEEIGVREFVRREHDLEFKENGVSQLAIVLRPVTNRVEQPDSLLRSLIDAIWLSMRENRNRVGSKVSIPDVPTTDTITSDTLQQTAHRLDGWLHEMNREHPEELPRDWRAMYARCPELIDLRRTQGSTGVVNSAAPTPTVATPAVVIAVADGKLIETRTNGPRGGRFLTVGGKDYDVPTGCVYRMLDYFWNRPSGVLAYDSMNDPGVEIFDSEVGLSSIRNVVNKLNSLLNKANVNWHLKPDARSRQLSRIESPYIPRKSRRKRPLKKSRRSL